jgi:hypothetical protein
MVDLETFSVHPSNAAIVSLALVKFKMEGPGPIIDREGARVIMLDVRHQFLAGREFSPDTQKWWLQQDEKVRELARFGIPLGPAVAMSTIEEYLTDPAMPVWANGSVFDIGNLETFFLQFGRPVPWKYNSPRDARTVYAVFPKRRSKPEDMKLVLHDPLDDCIGQIWKLWERWPFS